MMKSQACVPLQTSISKFQLCVRSPVTDCQPVTSTRTTFEGRCAQYEFLLNSVSSFVGELPWRMKENSQFCVQGVFTEAGQMAMNFKPDPQHLDVHIAFRWVCSAPHPLPSHPLCSLFLRMSNNNNDYLERLTRTGPKRLHVLYKYILSKFNA